MLIPYWFDEKVYFSNKLTALGNSYNELTLIAAFQTAGYTHTPEGLYQHFLDYGNAENISPNPWFNAQEYLYNKAVHYYGRSNVTTDQVKSMQYAMTGAGMSSWDHFNEYWAEYYADGKPADASFMNPSADFNVAAYMQAKLDLMPAGYTMPQLVKDFQDCGLNPLEHYLLYGKAENLTPEPVGGTVPGNAVMLTPGEDVLFGTSGADYFYAKLGSLNDQDYLDGLGGKDTLYANIEAGKAITPEITHIETVLFRVQQYESGGGNNLTRGNIDAERISLDKGQTLTLGSDNSRAHFIIEDIRHLSTETAIRFSNTDPGVDFKAYFHDQWLANSGTTSTGSMYIQLMDVKNGQMVGKPLYDNPFDTFTFQYTDNAGTVQKITLGLGKIKDNSTYDDLLTAFQNALANSPVKGLVTAKLGDPFTASVAVGDKGYTYQGDLIVFETASGSLAVKKPDGTAIPGMGWGVSSGAVSPTGGMVWDANNISDSSCPLLTTKIELDNVGHLRWTDNNTDCLPDNSLYGSQAGEMIVGIMGGRGGLERFDVTVDQSSWLTRLDSTNNTLRMVKVVNGVINGGNDNGHLFIGRSLEAMKTTTEPGGEATDLGTVAWMNIPRLLSVDGLTDVKFFDSTAMTSNVNIGAQLTAKCYEKYLKDVDGILDMDGQYAPKGAFQYLFGKGKDTLNLEVNTGIAADRDFLLKINMGDGDDLLNFVFTEPTGARVMDQIALNNVRVELGEGDDEAWFFGSGAVDVKAGTGNNAVFTGQNTSQNAVFVLGSSAAALIHVGPDGAQPLFSDIASAQTRGIGLTDSDVITSKHYVQLWVNFDGIRTEKVKIALTDKQEFVSVDEANRAVTYAIQNDPALSKLLRVSDGMNSSLIVEHLGNGKFVAGSLQVVCGVVGWPQAYVDGEGLYTGATAC